MFTRGRVKKLVRFGLLAAVFWAVGASGGFAEETAVMPDFEAGIDLGGRLEEVDFGVGSEDANVSPSEVGGEIGDEPHNAVVFMFVWNRDEPDNGNILLVGGTWDGAWVTLNDLPIEMAGSDFSAEERAAGDFEGSAVPCSVLLLQRGDAVTFYATDGTLMGKSAVEGLFYSRNPAVDDDWVEIKLAYGIPPERGDLYIGLTGNWNPVPAPTRREVSGDAVVFSTDLYGGAKTEVVFGKVREDGEEFYRGSAIMGGTTWPLTDFYAESPDEVNGLFIDLNGDGRMEFATCLNGFACYYDFGPDGPVLAGGLALGEN